MATSNAATTYLENKLLSLIFKNNAGSFSSPGDSIYVGLATAVSNAESSMCFLASHTILQNIVMGGMSGFVPNGSNDKNIDESTIKGVYIKMDPDSAITKSPYVQNCSAIGGAAIGA